MVYDIHWSLLASSIAVSISSLCFEKEKDQAKFLVLIFLTDDACKGAKVHQRVCNTSIVWRKTEFEVTLFVTLRRVSRWIWALLMACCPCGGELSIQHTFYPKMRTDLTAMRSVEFTVFLMKRLYEGHVLYTVTMLQCLHYIRLNCFSISEFWFFLKYSTCSYIPNTFIQSISWYMYTLHKLTLHTIIIQGEQKVPIWYKMLVFLGKEISAVR